MTALPAASSSSVGDSQAGMIAGSVLDGIHRPRQESSARTYARHLPLEVVEAQGIRVRDRSGRWFIDCLAGAGTVALGHGHPVLREALLDVIRSDAAWATLDFPSPLRDRFVEELFSVLPPGLANDGVVHLCAPSGTNAVEAAMTLCEAATGGVEHVAVEGGFHGCTRGARSVSAGGGLRQHQASFAPPVHFVPFPQDYRCPFGVGGNAGALLAAAQFDRLLTSPGSGLTRPASFIAEFVQGEAGSLPAPVPWMRAVRERTASIGLPLVADEIQAGVGRTGRMWSFDHGDIEPDVVLISKGLGGGIPIAVIVMRSELNVWEPGAFTGTFRGGALGFAAAAAVLRFVREEHLTAHVAAQGEHLLRLLDETRRRCPSVGDVRGRGLMIGAEIVDPSAEADERGVRPAAPSLARRIQYGCYERGLIVEIGGAHDNVVRFLPPLVIDHDDVERIAEIFDDAVVSEEHDPA